MSLSTKIFAGLLLGIATGLFFGELTAVLAPVGEAFVQLLKMAVLPYIVVSLMSGLGRLDYGEARVLFLRMGGFLVVIWALSFAVLAVVPLTFPSLETASFFSTTLLDQPPPFDFLEFIPENPFSSMANSVVPAVVLFSIAVGVALMGIERKETLIETLEVFGDALRRVMGFVTRLTPYGVFAIAASAAGTLRFDELGRLQVYVLVYVATSLLMTFGLLPGLVMMLAPVRYRDLMARTRDALVTGFATDNLLIVLPILAVEGKRLVAETGRGDEESDAAIDVILPASFNFPNAGKVLQLSFVLFAAWFAEVAISLGEYARLMFSGLLGFFGKPVALMPFLLDMLQVPADLFQLYLVSGILVARFGTLVAVMQTFVLGILGAYAAVGLLRFQWRSCLVALGLSAALLVAMVAGGRAYFDFALRGHYDKDEILAQMHVLERGVKSRVHLEPVPPPQEDRSRPALERIRERGFMRVGYVLDVLPFQFFNADGELVGFDSAMAHELARELGVDLEFVPVTRENMETALDEGRCDIIMSGIALGPTRVETMRASRPYVDMTFAFVVRDHEREKFNSLAAVRSLEAPRVAVLSQLPHITLLVEKLAPNAELIPVRTPSEFFDAEEGRFDAFVYGAEMGSAWSLIRPEFTVAIPHPAVIEIPLVYYASRDAADLMAYVDAFIEIKRSGGTIQRNYDYWILGRDAAVAEPRWSVIRDVLHWID